MQSQDINIRDPFVLVHGGKYYLYGTRGATCWGVASGFDVYVSDDLETWDGPHVCFENDGSFWADRNYWAPEVHPWRGAFYMFASFKSETRRRGTAILRAETPMGPYAPWSDGPVTPAAWECLDGTFYADRQGRPYMVFCHEWVQAGDGSICALPLTDDLRAPAGEPLTLFHASQAAWCRAIKHSSGMEGFVTDGPFLWRLADGGLALLWASLSESGYTEGQAVSESGEIDGPWRQAEPLFRQDGGHGMVFRGLDGQLRLTLHSPNEHLKERPHFYPIEEKAGRLAMP
ncbi:MAG: family 43 glycosylhydrolase [Clostridia bacterium]|nr:family 43 glycosylhydrolase [Clostridia bacterium]